MTREEALQAIKEKMDYYESDKRLRGAIETLVPELRESEDEKFRKYILQCCKECIEANDKGLELSMSTTKKLLAYLEKQKEHQFCSDAPKEKSVGGIFYSSHKDKNLDEIAQDYVDGVKQYNPEPTWDLMQTAVCYGANWQKEQFEKNRLANCDALSKEEYDRETDFAMEIIEKEHRQPTFNDAINYGMRLQKEQKQEWSEEEKRAIDRACVALRAYSKGDLPEFLPSELLGYADRLQSLRPQPKKELSIEKAIQWLDDTFYFLDNSSGRGKDCEITTHDFDSLEEMYDSFRKAVTVDSQPHWKPSEEQMEALDKAIPVCMVVVGRDEIMPLKSLLRDLNKLR